MRLILHNGTSEALEEFRPASAPRCSLVWLLPGDDGTLAGFRRESFRSCLSSSLTYLGFEFAAGGGELACAFEAPSGSGFWLRPAAEERPGPAAAEILAKGFDPLDLRLYCLSTHYRLPLRFEWDALEFARGERQGLRDAAQRLRARAGGSAPNPTGLAGYRKRFRDALSADLDLPRAISALWDALRPGALSPGSQLAALEEADRVLGLLQLG